MFESDRYDPKISQMEVRTCGIRNLSGRDFALCTYVYQSDYAAMKNIEIESFLIHAHNAQSIEFVCHLVQTSNVTKDYNKRHSI